MIESNGISGARRVSDVSGDGEETRLWFKRATLLPQTREIAEAKRAVVNGLAILTDFPKLDEWYRQHVIVGPASFVIRAELFEDFKEAFWKKLLRELSSPVASKERRPASAAVSSAVHLILLQNSVARFFDVRYW